jgi:hypothetical protein
MGPNGVEPHPKNIWAKPDQQFNGVATDWEQKNSELCLPTGSFHPVVDSTTMVVAHYAEVLGNRMVSIRLDEEVWESIRDSYLKNNYEQTCNHGSCWYHIPGQGYNVGPIRVCGPNGSWVGPPDVC